MKNYQLPALLAVVLLLLFGSSCRKERFFTDSSAKLRFSTDTVLFDTVFTKLGSTGNPRSVNRRFTVTNPHNQTIKTNIRLAGGANSPFRINIDGMVSTEVKDYEIRKEDSIYLFVEVTIDPNNLSNPLIVYDSILFETNGNVQDVKLVAWGQDAYYFEDSVLACNITWADKTKPYVIFNSVLVPEGCKLTIMEGVKVYSSVNSRLYVNGTLEVKGTAAERVVFQGSRLENRFDDVPGQWWGIRFLPASKNNSITYADIRNGIIGVEVDSLQAGGAPKLNISQTDIRNMSAAGLVGYTARIEALNCVVVNCGQYTFLGELGGHYLLTHCTFANYSTTFSRQKPHFGLSNADYKDGAGAVTTNALWYDMRNSIVYGSLTEELVFFEGGGGALTKNIADCILKTETTGLAVSNKLNIDPRFKNFRELDFQLDTLSPATDAAPALLPPVLVDVKGEPRVLPDIGAYERK